EPSSGAWMRGGHRTACQVAQLLERLLIGNCHPQLAVTKAERHALADRAAPLLDQVGTRDAQIDDAVPGVLRDVLGSNEEQVERVVVAGRKEAPIVRLELVAGLAQQRDRRFGKATLVGDREAQPSAGEPGTAGHFARALR